MVKIEACVFQISPSVPAHLGRSCPSHLEFLLQLRHTSWGWQVFGWLPEFTRETSLGQQQAHCMICMVSCHNIPKWDGRTKTAQSSHQQQANLTSKDFFQWQIRSCRMPLAARKHLGRLVLLSCQCIQLLLQFGFWRAFDDEDNEHTIWGSGKHLWDARFYWNKETARNSIVPSACEKSHHRDSGTNIFASSLTSCSSLFFATLFFSFCSSKQVVPFSKCVKREKRGWGPKVVWKSFLNPAKTYLQGGHSKSQQWIFKNMRQHRH